jgi:DnaD/phage-associated family protein
MKYRINWDGAGGAAAIPLSVKDPLKNARPKAVKWLMYVLLTGDYNIKSAASALSMDTDDTEEALMFWRDRGVVVGDEKSDTVSAYETPHTDSACENAAKINTPKRDYRRDLLKPRDKKEVTELIEGDEKLVSFFEGLEKITAGPPTFTEQRTYIYIHGFYGLNTAEILMLADFAVSIGKYKNRSPAYVDYLAKDFTSRGIFSHKDVSSELTKLREYYTFEGRVKAAFGIDRELTAKERGCIENWKDFGFADDIFHFAFEVTVNGTGALKFAYADKVLRSWHDAGIRSLEALTEYNERFLAEHKDYSYTRKARRKTVKNNGVPSFDLTNAENEDFEAALRGELG